MTMIVNQPTLFDVTPRPIGTDARKPQALPGWATGEVSVRLVGPDREPIRESCPAWIVDGLAVHIVHWCRGDSKEPRYTMSSLASGYCLWPQYLETKLPKARAMASRVVGLPEWTAVRDDDGTGDRRGAADAVRSIGNRIGEWLDWPYGWDRVPVRPARPVSLGDAVERYRAAKSTWLHMAWFNPTLADEYRILALYARADLAGMIGPSSHFDRDGRRYQVGTDGVMVDDEMGMTGIEIPRI